ncbi:MAG: ATP-binding cassette protein [Microbacteriaceae bacterium]|nr:ATP-binding cassette protein [Microbacteriaceae bacterium]
MLSIRDGISERDSDWYGGVVDPEPELPDAQPTQSTGAPGARRPAAVRKPATARKPAAAKVTGSPDATEAHQDPTPLFVAPVVKAVTDASPAPKTTKPRSTTPRSTTPKSTTPKTATPKTSTPQAAAPKTANPQAAAPKAAIPKAATPKAATPKTPAARTTKPRIPPASAAPVEDAMTPPAAPAPTKRPAARKPAQRKPVASVAATAVPMTEAPVTDVSPAEPAPPAKAPVAEAALLGTAAPVPDATPVPEIAPVEAPAAVAAPRAELIAQERPQPGEVVLRISGLVKRFDDTTAVAGVDLEIAAGTFFGIVGPNGAGKTTTLSMVTGLLKPDSGTVTVHGADVWSNPTAAKRSMGVLPDRLRLFDRLTGAQLLYYSGILHGLDKKVVRSRSADLAAAFGLEDSLDRLVTDYSAGMTKKIALAAAMLHSPRLLVLDEPFESVDPVSAANIIEILQRYVTAGGTVVMSSHTMNLIERICDSVAVVVNGAVLATGTMAEVRGTMTLEERFVELAGGRKAAEGMEWLHKFSG